ncbi:hypothetical protein LCGC14_0374730 [marine sediment metagenome]|uniref:Uncharacterized protein n=1 Tax=marine sediment metagenome TaxID=412755 RepID=A0A0F9WCZ6_9ZZZZ
MDKNILGADPKKVKIIKIKASKELLKALAARKRQQKNKFL